MDDRLRSVLARLLLQYSVWSRGSSMPPDSKLWTCSYRDSARSYTVWLSLSTAGSP